MNMYAAEAAEFAEDWIVSGRSREDFEIFRDAFEFADSASGMNMSSRDAKDFAFEELEKRIEKRTLH